MNRKCLPWGEFQDKDIKIKKQQINVEYKREGFKEKDFLKSIRDELKKGAELGNKCQSLENGKPVCIVDADGQTLLSKCFPDFYLKESDENSTQTEEVKDLDTCNQWMEDYTSRFGPIDANLCLGDNQTLPLTPKEIKEGKDPQKIVSLSVIINFLIGEQIYIIDKLFLENTKVKNKKYTEREVIFIV